MAGIKKLKLSKLLRMVRNKSDYADSQFVSDEELVDMLNVFREELYTQVVDRCEPSKLQAALTIIPLGGIVELPENIYKITMVSNQGREMKEAHYNPANKELQGDSYYLRGNSIFVSSGVPSVDLVYFPMPTDLELPEEDEDNEWLTDPDIDLLCLEEQAFLLASLVMYIKEKDESDFSLAMQEKLTAYQRIISTFQQHNIQPAKVRKVW